MLKQHPFYVYYDGNRVLARMGAEKPVVAETLGSTQEAHDRVQALLNPSGRAASEYGPLGFHEPAYQAAISANAEAYVKAAYGVAEQKKESKPKRRR